MSTTADLMGLGMPPGLADRLGITPASLAGNGTAQTGATKVSGAALNLVTPSGGNTAFVLSANYSTGRPIYIFNVSATTAALIFPPSAGTINGNSANASVSLAANKGGIFILGNGSGVAAEQWLALLSA